MEPSQVEEWFEEYLGVFEACGRGESGPDALMAYYGVPLVFGTDGGSFAAMSEEQVVAAVGTQIDGMRADAYHHSEVLDSEVTVLNAACALFRGRFSRRRQDESEIGQLEATYLITDGPAGRRISALVVHGG